MNRIEWNGKRDGITEGEIKWNELLALPNDG